MAQLNYDLPFGKGRHFLNRGGILNQVSADGQFLTIQSVRSGLPVVSVWGSPNRYLPGEGNAPNVVAGQAVNVFELLDRPEYVADHLAESLLQHQCVLQPGGFHARKRRVRHWSGRLCWWPQYSVTKTWTYKEKWKLTLRMDAQQSISGGPVAEHGQQHGESRESSDFW